MGETPRRSIPSWRDIPAPEGRNIPGEMIPIILFLSMGFVGFSFSPIGRGIARRLSGEAGDPAELNALRDEVAQLRAELDEMHGRLEGVDELANRVDFAERMLAQVRAKNALPGGE